MPRRGNKRKKTRTHVTEDATAQSALSSNDNLNVPRSAVIRRGKVETEVMELVTDLRKLLRPYTALNLKEDAKNRKATLASYASRLSGPLGVTHLLALSQNSSHINLRIARTPSNGPTLSFQVKQFTLTKHVLLSQKRPYYSTALFDHAAVVVTNNFGDNSVAPHVKLMRITFQNMFPAINVGTVNLSDCRRVVLFNYVPTNDGDGDGEEEMVEVRHYAIRAAPVGVDRKLRKLVQANIPDLSRLDDIADFVAGTNTTSASAASVNSGSNMSDSEAEDETSHVVLPQRYHGRGNAKHQKSALKLVELGPRLRLKLVKIERGLSCGDVMYHAHVKKSVEEAKAQKQKIEKRDMLKKQRRAEQDANVAKKKQVKDQKKEDKKRRRDDREKEIMDELRGEKDNRNVDSDDDDDDDSQDGDSGSEDENESGSEDDDSGEE